MPFRDIFRGLMGLPPQTPDQNNNRDPWANDLFHDLLREFTHQTEEPPDDDSGWYHQAPYEEDSSDDFGFHLFQQTDDMFRHFEEQFRRTFEGFGMMEFPSEFGPPPIEAPPASPGNDGGSLRDRMLKPGAGGRARRADADLDDRVTESGLSALLEEQHPPAEPPPSVVVTPFGSFSGGFSGSVAIRQHIGPDGCVEERRVESGPDGARRETVTRRVGDQQQTTVTVRRPDGTDEVEEHLTNMDQVDLPQFERLWQGMPRQDAPDQPQRPNLGGSFWSSLFW